MKKIFLGETETSTDGVEDIESRFSEAFCEADKFWARENGWVKGWMLGYFIPALEKRGLVITTRENFNAHKVY